MHLPVGVIFGFLSRQAAPHIYYIHALYIMYILYVYIRLSTYLAGRSQCQKSARQQLWSTTRQSWDCRNFGGAPPETPFKKRPFRNCMWFWPHRTALFSFTFDVLPSLQFIGRHQQTSSC